MGVTGGAIGVILAKMLMARAVRCAVSRNSTRQNSA